MEILKTATLWAKDEAFSSMFFVLFGISFVLATVGFWQLGKTETAKAFIFPTLVAGILLLAVGLGLFFTNKSRMASFPDAYNSDPSAFVAAEIVRAEKTLAEYQNIVFRTIPVIIAVAALSIVFFNQPIWRAICITSIAMLLCILLVDTNANSRIETYHKQLVLAAKQEIP